MRKLIFILFLSGQLLAQPSATIIKFVDNHIGQKVGSGKCFDLVDGAYMKVNRKWKDKIVNHKYNYGKIIDSSDIQPGDIVLWDKLIRYDGKKLPDHVGIVYSVSNGKIIIAQQNVSGSPVELDDFSMCFGKPEFTLSREVTFYRLP